MKKSIIFSVLCMIEVLCSAPNTNDEDKNMFISRKFFDMASVKYQAQHDIVEILVPLVYRAQVNFENFNKSESILDQAERFMKDIVIFFVEADVQNGERVDQGLYVFKNGQAKNILPTGRTAATTNNKNYVFFGASDGLFAYDLLSNSAVKYGPITDGIISIAAADETQYTLYILTDDHKLYKVSNGATKDLVSDVQDAEEIVLDNNQNIYYYNFNNEVFVRTPNGVIRIRDLPPNPKSLKLIRAPFLMNDSVPLMFDDTLYIVYANGTSEIGNLEFSPDARPSAYAVEAVLIQYFAVNKKLYEYNFMNLTAQDRFEDLNYRAANVFTKVTKPKNTLGTRRA